MRSAQSTGLSRFYVTCLLPRTRAASPSQRRGSARGCSGPGHLWAPLAPGLVPAGTPARERECERGQAGGAWGGCPGQGPARSCSPGARGAARAALRRWGWGGRGSGPLELGVSASSGRGFPGPCLLLAASGACFLGFPLALLFPLPLSSPCAKFMASAMRWVWLPSKLLTVVLCGGSVLCYSVFTDGKFSRLFFSSCSSGLKLGRDCCRTNRMIKKTCGINYVCWLGWAIR